MITTSASTAAYDGASPVKASPTEESSTDSGSSQRRAVLSAR